MGIIIGKFMRKKNTYEILEKLETEIKKIEEYGRSTELTRNRIVTRFILVAILSYLVVALLIYFYYDHISDKMICFVPFIAFPFIIFLVKKLLTWYYTRKLRKNQKKLEKYTVEKKKILENVMETETYKVAKQILDRFGNEKQQQKPFETIKSEAVTPRLHTPVTPAVRQRVIRHTELPVPKRVSFGEPSLAPVTPQIKNTPRQMLKPLPRPMMKKERTILDKLMDYLVDDGPSNRYALICKRCHGHNGAAHKDEFDYLSYDCSYCLFHNAAPKKRSTAPSIEVPPVRITPAPPSDSSDSESDDAVDPTSPLVSNTDTNDSVEDASTPDRTDNFDAEKAPADGQTDTTS